MDSRGKDNRETQQYIEDIISIDKTSFANSIVFGQGYSKNLRRFSELTDKEQKECLEKILDLEAFSAAHEKTSKEIKTLVSQRALHQSQREIITAAIGDLEESLVEACESKNTFDTTREDRVVSARERCDSLTQNIDSLLEEVSKLPQNREEDEVDGDISEYKNELSNYQDKKDLVKEKYSESKSKFLVINNGIKKEIDSLRTKADKLSDGADEGEECFHCGALVLNTRLADRKGDLQFEIDDRGRTVKEIDLKIAQLTARYTSKITEIVEVIEMITEVLERLVEEKRNIFVTANELERLNSKIDYERAGLAAYSEQITRLMEEGNPYTSLVEKLEISIADKNKKVEEIDKVVGNLDVEMEYYKFWKIGFSRTGIRSFLLDQIIPFLNERANKYLTILTDGGIEVCFNARKQLASGEWRESFNVEVVNKSAADTYEGNSGGEKRRIDLAISLAINDFIASRSGKRFNLLLLDEVFENIDETGVYFVIKVLEELSRNRSSVFVITHQDSLASYFDDTIMFSRREGLSVLH